MQANKEYKYFYNTHVISAWVKTEPELMFRAKGDCITKVLVRESENQIPMELKEYGKRKEN